MSSKLGFYGGYLVPHRLWVQGGSGPEIIVNRLRRCVVVGVVCVVICMFCLHFRSSYTCPIRYVLLVYLSWCQSSCCPLRVFPCLLHVCIGMRPFILRCWVLEFDIKFHVYVQVRPLRTVKRLEMIRVFLNDMRKEGEEEIGEGEGGWGSEGGREGGGRRKGKGGGVHFD